MRTPTYLDRRGMVVNAWRYRNKNCKYINQTHKHIRRITCQSNRLRPLTQTPPALPYLDDDYELQSTANKISHYNWPFREDKLKTDTLQKLCTTQKKQKHKTQQNKTALVQSPHTTLGQETRWAYYTMLPSPHWAHLAEATQHVILAKLLYSISPQSLKYLHKQHIA